MAVTVTSVTPTTVASAGSSKVEIIGTGFRLPTPSSSTTGPAPKAPESVRVYFGPVLAQRVRVISTTRLLVTPAPGAPGVHDVRVVNVDDFGAPLEEGVLAAAITFTLPSLITLESDLVRVVRAMINALKNQVINEVVLSSHVDWDDMPDAFPRETTIATTPAISLSGPSLRKSDSVYIDPGPTYTDVDGIGAEESRSPKTRDLVFSILAIAVKYTPILNLTQAVESFFIHNTKLAVLRDPNVPERGFLEYEVELEEDLIVDSAPNADGMYTAAGSFVIKGVDILGMPGVLGDLVTDTHPSVNDEPEVDTVAT